MGVNTKAIIRKGTTIEQIKDAIEVKYGSCEIHANQPDFMFVNFQDGTDKRSLAVSFTDSCERDYGIAGVWLSLGRYGNSVGILRYLCETFGGYLDEDDCDEEGFYPINFHLYQQGKEFTNHDLFINEVISKLGYDNLKIAMELFEKYVTNVTPTKLYGVFSPENDLLDLFTTKESAKKRQYVFEKEHGIGFYIDDVPIKK